MTNSHDVLHKLVTQTEKDRTVTGTVAVSNPISGFATSAKQLADGHNVNVSNPISGFATSAKQLADGHNVTVTKDRTVTNAVAANLKSEVTQAAKDRTITGTATVTPSGDMARLAYYDRDSAMTVNHYGASLGAHAYTVRWVYTVPGNRKMIHGLFYGEVEIAISVEGTLALVKIDVRKYGGERYTIFSNVQFSGEEYGIYRVSTATFALIEGDKMECKTYSTDAIDHWIAGDSLGTEFDE